MSKDQAKPGFGKRKFEDQATGHSYIDWREELQRFLIAGGTNGQPHAAVMRRLVAHAKTAEVQVELDALLELEKIQKFEVPAMGRGKPTTVWRATTKILES